MKTLSWEKFTPLFGDWASFIKPGFDRGLLDEVYAHLKARSQEGHLITPVHAEVFRAFPSTPFKSLKAVVMGMCPYHSRNKQGLLVADGLAMSCSHNQFSELQPSLDQLYGALERELCGGLALEMVRENSLDYLAKQGVMLLNASLTTEVGTAGVHHNLWQPFMSFLVAEVLAPTGVPFLFLGKKAQHYIGCLDFLHHYRALEHPAHSSYKGEEWNSEGAFVWLNTEISRMGKDPIEWVERLPF